MEILAGKFRLSHPFFLLVLFGLFFHISIALILFSYGFPICYVPYYITDVAGALLISIPITCTGAIVFSWVLKDGFLKKSGRKVEPIRNRLIDTWHMILQMAVFGFIYLIILIPYLNLKPAIPLLNPHNYDMGLEFLERTIFGGVLPTEWFIHNSSFVMVAFWNFIYDLFTPFIFISLAIAVKYEGFSGGSLLMLAYIVGLFLCLLIALAFPSLGPIYIHPAWFERFSTLGTYQFAGLLEKTVRLYAQKPGTVYAISGIAAMPSYHIYACVCGLFSWRYLSKGLRLFGTGLVFLIWVSTFVLGWHYLLDGVVGTALGILVMGALQRLNRKTEAMARRT